MKELFTNNLFFDGYEKAYEDYCEWMDIEINLNDIYDWLAVAKEDDWHDFIDQLRMNQEDLRVLVTGTFMSWNGPQKGGQIYNSLEDAISGVLLDESTFTIYLDDNKNLCVHETHHDSPVVGNHYEFRYITQIGENWLDKNGESHTEECHEELKKARRSKKVGWRQCAV